jgi:cytochrome P450
MPTTPASAPGAPRETFDPSGDILAWMGEQFGRHGDIFFARAFGTEMCAVNTAEHAQHVLRKNWRNYRKGFAIKRIAMLLGKGLMVSEGELWKTQRKVIQPAFHGAAVRQFADVIAEANDELRVRWVEAAAHGRTVNLTRDISHMVLKSTLLTIFGDDYATAAAPFAILSDEAARDLEFAQAFVPLRNVVAQIIGLRRSRGAVAPDILGLMMSALDPDGGAAMSDGQLISEVMTLVVAGHETTAITLAWAWWLLSQSPAVEQRLHQELDLPGAAQGPAGRDRFPFTRQVIEETMRLYPPGWLMTRRAICDDQLGDHHIRAGTEVYISPYFLQRNPAYWADPERFDPDRFSVERSADRPELAMLPFSAGPRNCVGETLARVEMQTHLTTIASHLRLRCCSHEQPQLSPGVNLRSKTDLIATPMLRIPRGASAVSGLVLAN